MLERKREPLAFAVPTARRIRGEQMTIEQELVTHYGRGSLEQEILAALAAAGKDTSALKVDDLTPIDHFHTGGKQATDDLLSQVAISPDSHILDLGSGVGGPARYVAQTHGCRVTGIDITPEFVDVATNLTQRVGLHDRVAFRSGSALDLPFPAATFDGAYMLHVGMNIADKPALFAGVRRVLRSNGFFAIFDIMQTADGTLTFPVAWSATAVTSFVATPSAYRQALQDAGFIVLSERNRHQFAMDSTSQPVTTHVLIGTTAGEKLANARAGLAAGLIAPVEMIARAH